MSSELELFQAYRGALYRCTSHGRYYVVHLLDGYQRLIPSEYRIPVPLCFDPCQVSRVLVDQLREDRGSWDVDWSEIDQFLA
jgi:hypothetical protein